MKNAEIRGREAAGLEQGDGERVAEHDLQGGRGGGRQPVGAGLARLRQHQRDIGLARQGRLRLASDRDQSDAKAPRIGQEVGELRRLARPGEGEHHIVGLDHAKIAMARLGRMHEIGGRAGRGESGGDLAPDMAGFAHAGDDDSPFRGADQGDGTLQRRAELAREGGREGIEAFSLGTEGAQRRGDRLAARRLRRLAETVHASARLRSAARYNPRPWS
jgi:hypothetical protein